ncbi:MAG: M28 family peptidase [Phycisphaeraceae bacterium]|nr:M28 family peptidase [Phycisphaeraceae bacterium]
MLNLFAAAIIALQSPVPPAPPAAPPAAPLAGPEAEVSRERVMADLAELPTKRAAWGDQAHRAGLRDTEKQLAEKLLALGYEVALDPIDFIGGGGRREGEDPWNNLVVEIKGRTLPSEVLIFAAHFDAMPNCPGAEDNGSGVAALLEMARLLKDRPMHRTVRLIFFNLEENGLVGSRAYVERMLEKWNSGDERVLGMVSFDMIGYYTDEPDSQKSPIPPRGNFKPPTVGNFLGLGGILQHRWWSTALLRAMHEAEPKLPTYALDFLPIAPPDLLRSDHAPFLAAGQPAVILSTTAEMRYAHYHRPTDTIDKIEPERYTLAVRALVGAAWRLAGPADKPVLPLGPPGMEQEPGK